MDAKIGSRQNYLDWLRVLLILAVFIFHSTRFFDTIDWQVKNASTYFGIQINVYFMSSWMMPLIFVVSGASVYYAMGKRGAGQFIKERVLRLLVPLVLGLFTHVALQAYLERVSHGRYVGSFWQWLPEYITQTGSAGGFSWTGHHLWYLEALFLFSLVCLPAFVWLRQGAGAGLLTRFGNWLGSPSLVYLPMVLVIIPSVLMDPDGSVLADYNSFGGWNIPSYLIFFLAGFLLPASQRLQASILRLRWVSLAAGVATTIACFGLIAIAGLPDYGSLNYALVFVFRGMTGWCWVLALLGLGMRWLNTRSPFLEYANQTVMPFYILHQSVLIAIGFFVVQWNIPDLAKWAVIVLSSFASILLAYELLIRRINLLRFLFGMKTLKKAPQVSPLTVQPALR